MSSNKILTLEALECYDRKIKNYIDMRCYEIVRDSLQWTIDSRIDQVEEEEYKDGNKYYYPLFERRGL